MNIQSVILIYAGGVGSGPNAPCPQCGPHTGKSQVSEGDTVSLKVPHKLYNFKTGNLDPVHGLKGTVVHVLPKIGSNDQMVKLMVKAPSKKYEDDSMVHVKMNDVELHHTGTVFTPTPKGDMDVPLWHAPWFKPQGEWKKLDLQPVPKSQVLMKFKTNDGATVTWVKPKEEKEEQDPKSLTEKPHSDKGDFKMQVVVPSGPNRSTYIFDTNDNPKEASKGTVLWVETKRDNYKLTGISVREQNYGQYVNKTSTVNFNYKNAAAAVGMLRRRYGISMKLSALRVGM